MKRNHSLALSIATMALLVSSSAVAQVNDRRDGNWWRSEDKSSKLAYVTGFFDGMDLGHNFSYWSFGPNKGKADDPCLAKNLASYTDYNRKYLSHVTNGQLVDGLESFYEDYRNRRIRVADAVWLVLNGIAGTPQAKLDEMIENWRKNASD